LLASLLRRLDCTVWPIAFAVVVFALTEDSIFYFSSASPYACAVCLQLIAFHLLLSMKQRAGFALAVALGAVLTASYLIRINLIFFIALSLAIAWVRAGQDRWRVYYCSAAIFIVTWSLLGLVWGSQFAYVSLWLPGVTDWLVQAGVMPKLYPNARRLSSQMAMDTHPPTISGVLAHAFGWPMLMNWILWHHILPIGAAFCATVATAARKIPNRGWIALFAGSYWAMLIFHHLGAQSYCPICIQAYANYFNYLAALAGGLTLHGLLQIVPNARLARGAAICVIAGSLGLAALQSWSLNRGNQLPSIRNQTDSLPQEVRMAGEAVKTLLTPGSTVEFVGRDPRIPLALAHADIRVPPVTLSLTSFYRKLNDNLSPEQVARATEEIRQLSMWTDDVAKAWIQDSGDWLILQRQPVDYVFPWLLWSPQAPFMKIGLEKCFEPVAEKTFDRFEPPLAFALYRRTKRGKLCLGE